MTIPRLFRMLVAWAVVSVVLSFPLNGKHMMPDLVDVPIDRLIRNLEAKAKKEPHNVEVRYNIARAHAMAFALRTNTAKVSKGRETNGVWFGYESKTVPFEVTPTTAPARLRAANRHLKLAILQYAEVVSLAPDRLEAALGYAWCIEQSGQKQEAIARYRKIIVDAWDLEKDKKQAGLGWHPITSEAADYLIPLLDKDVDPAEIKTLKERIEKLGRVPRKITPIVIPLKRNLTIDDLEDHSASVAFDADGTGLRKRWTWITGDAGWLVWDPRDSGKISSSLQLFGDVTFWMFWEHGYHVLAALDDNHDGLLNGNELEGLAVWQDRNRNGISEPGEVSKLSTLGIVELSCKYEQDLNHPDYIAFSPQGVVFNDGSTRATYDLMLHPAVSSID